MASNETGGKSVKILAADEDAEEVCLYDSSQRGADMSS